MLAKVFLDKRLALPQLLVECGRSAICWSLVIPLSALGQDKLPTLSGPELGLPSLGRVLFGFVLMVGIAFAVVAFLRKGKRWLPLPSLGSNTAVVIVSRRQLARNLDVHVIDVDSQRFMVVSSPRQVVVTPLIMPEQHNTSTASSKE